MRLRHEASRLRYVIETDSGRFVEQHGDEAVAEARLAELSAHGHASRSLAQLAQELLGSARSVVERIEAGEYDEELHDLRAVEVEGGVDEGGHDYGAKQRKTVIRAIDGRLALLERLAE